MKIFKKRKVDMDRVPKHVAFIMDGNGRWAKKRGLVRTAGHEEGAKRVQDLARNAKEFGIKVVTVYTFSTENWKRPKEEVDYIFNLVKKLLVEGKEDFKKNNVRVYFIGKIEELDDDFKKLIYETMEETKNNDGITLNFAFNYGGRSEITEMVKNIASDCVSNKLKVEDINEKLIDSYLMTKDLPPIDLMVRTSGEVRLSNFLLWQLAYSELIFTGTYWPDFDKKNLEKILIEFQSRNRRYGGLK